MRARRGGGRSTFDASKGLLEVTGVAEEAAAFLAQHLFGEGPWQGGGGGAPRRILLPYTSSDPARHALAAMVGLFSSSAAEVRVVHFREIEHVRGVRFYRETAEESVAVVAEAVTGLRGRGVAASGTVRDASSSRIAYGIVAEALEFGAEAIVLGARPRHPFLAMLLGSISLGVVRLAHCPVILVPPPRHRRSSPRPGAGTEAPSEGRWPGRRAA